MLKKEGKAINLSCYYYNLLLYNSYITLPLPLLLYLLLFSLILLLSLLYLLLLTLILLVFTVV